MTPGGLVLLGVLALLGGLGIVLGWTPLRLEVYWPGRRLVELSLQHPMIEVEATIDVVDANVEIRGQVAGVGIAWLRPHLEQLARRIRERAPREKPDKPKPDHDALEVFELTIARAEMVLGPALQMILEIPRVIELERAELTIAYGLGSPDWTGMAMGAMSAASAALPRPLRLQIIPRWHRVDLDGEAHLAVEVRPLRVVQAAALFGWRTLLEALDMRRNPAPAEG